MPRTDDPTARSIFDLLEEKYPREPHQEPPAARPARRPVPSSGQSVDTALDCGSRSLLLASLVVLLATALVTLSLKPDLPSTIVDTSPAVVHRAEAEPTSEIGIRNLTAEPTRGSRRIGGTGWRPAPEPATVATLTVAKPPVAEPAVRQAERPASRSTPAAPPPLAPIAAKGPDPSPDHRAQPTEVRQPPVGPTPATPMPATPIPAGSMLAAPEAGDEILAGDSSPETATVPDPVSERLRRTRAETAEIKPPMRLATPLPSYTQDAWVAGIQGDVLVRARIDKEGTVADVKVLRGLPHGLTEAAVAAVRRWRFRPASIDGEPVSADHDLSIRFTL
ncbi:MAG: TonB family protein [Thermoanaerobaculia bacterium]